MPELLFVSSDGLVRKSASGTVSTFSTTNIGTGVTTLNTIYSGNRMARASNGTLYVLGNSTVTSSALKLYRYNQKDGTLDLFYTSTNLRKTENSAIFSNGDNIIIFGQGVSLSTWDYEYSTDGGWTWTSVINPGITSTSVSDIIYFKGTYYIAQGANATFSNIYSFALGATYTLVSKGSAAHNVSFAILNDNLFAVGYEQNLRTRIFKFQSGSFVLKFTETLNISGFLKPGIIGDQITDKIHIIIPNGTTVAGYSSVDGTGETFVRADTIATGLTASTGSTGFKSLYEASLTNPWQCIYISSTGNQLLQWDSTLIKWISLSSSGTISYNGLYPYTSTAAFTRITPISLNSTTTRYKFDIQNYNINGSNNNIDPNFSTNWENWNVMTIDESKIGLSTVLQDITIGTDINKFNDDFAIDYITNESAYETIQSSLNITRSIGSGLFKHTMSGIGTNEYLKRFILTGNFKISIDYLNLSTNLATNNFLRFGIRAYILGSNGKFLDPDNFVEIYVKKDISTASFYQSKHRVIAIDNLSTTVVSGTSATPGLWISRSGSVFTTSYGSIETNLNPVTTLSSSNSVMIVIFVENQDTTSSEIFDLDNLHLYSVGSLMFIGGITSTINWDFVIDGITADQGNIISRVIGSTA